MPHPSIENHTPFHLEPLYVSDEQHRPLIAPVLKACFDIQTDGRITRALEQTALCLEGEYHGDPAHSSYLYEPEVAFIKPYTDVAIIADAIAPHASTTQLQLDIKVGALHKQLMVFGERAWFYQQGRWLKSAPQPFNQIALTYENAFGGWDRRSDDPKLHDFEARNTVGKGFYNPQVLTHAPLPLPNIEDPHHLIQTFGQRVAPVGIGFTLPHWQPRGALAGTFDQNWQTQRSPLLPEDFNRAYFNAASAGLIAADYLQGGEPVSLTHLTANGLLQFNLPYLKPVGQITIAHSEHPLDFKLDTVIINTRRMQLFMLWRDHHYLQDYQDVQQLYVTLA